MWDTEWAANVLRGLSDLSLMVWPQGWIGTATGDVVLRFRASEATNFVQVHVQKTGTGGATYNTSTYVSSTLVDCRSDRRQSVAVARDGTNDYYVWLIPVFTDAAGSVVKMDGVSADDLMATVSLGGAAAGETWTSVALGSNFGTASLTAQNVTGLKFTPAASTTYLVEFYLLLQTANAAVGPEPGLSWPTGLTTQGAWLRAPITVATAAERWWGAASAAGAATTGLPDTTNPYLATGRALLVAGGSVSGDLQVTLQAQSGGGATTVTMLAGSMIRYLAV